MALRNRMPDIPVIVVNRVHNGERQRFTLAHELAHLVLEFIGLSENDQEKAADRFAGAFLMAKELVLELLGRGRSMISLAEFTEVKKVLRVSIAGLVVRCSQLGVITRSTYQALWDQIKVLGWNGPHSTEPHPLPPESPERMYRLAIRAVADGVVSVSKAAEILGIDVKALNHRLVPGGT